MPGPLIDDDFRHNIVKIAVDRTRRSATIYFEIVMTKIIINKKTGHIKSDVNLSFIITDYNGQSGRTLMKRGLWGKDARKTDSYSI